MAVSKISLNSTSSSAMSLDVTSSWDDVLECDFAVDFNHMGDGEHESSGTLTATGICLMASRILNLQNSIQNWLDEPHFKPSGLRGIFELAYFQDDSKLTMSFDAGMDDYINVQIEYLFGNLNGMYTIQTDQSCLRLFAGAIGKSVRATNAG